MLIAQALFMVLQFAPMNRNGTYHPDALQIGTQYCKLSVHDVGIIGKIIPAKMDNFKKFFSGNHAGREGARVDFDEI